MVEKFRGRAAKATAPKKKVAKKTASTKTKEDK
jgi:hypothetical protein